MPLRNVIEARITKLSPYALWALALLMVVGGVIVTALMMMPILKGEGGEFSGYPPAIAIVGLVLPFVARGRSGLVISMVAGGFRWKPGLVVDRASKLAIESFLDQVAAAFRQAGVNIVDDRGGMVPAPVRVPSGKAHSDVARAIGVTRACFHCGRLLHVSRWDDWNGFLVQCPHCQQLHGRPWRAYFILLVSVLLNALSFFLTMRPKRAIAAFLGYVLLLAAVGFALNRELVPESLKLFFLAVALLGPFAINSGLLLRHETALKTAWVSKA